MVRSASSNWVMGRAVAHPWNMSHKNDNLLRLPALSGVNDYFSMNDDATLSPILLEQLINVHDLHLSSLSNPLILADHVLSISVFFLTVFLSILTYDV